MNWNDIKAQADLVIEEKPYLRDRNNWNDNALFHGWIGEWVVGEAAGMEPNLELLGKGKGDGGMDFPNTQVKTSLTRHPVTGEERTAKLMLSPDEKRTAKYFVLVALDVFAKSAWLCGWTTRKKLLAADERNFGYGVRRYMETYELREGLPPHLRVHQLEGKRWENDKTSTKNEPSNSSSKSLRSTATTATPSPAAR